MEWEERNGVELFRSVRGSWLFGLETDGSDIDTFGLFCCPERWLYGTGSEYVGYVADEKHDNYWDEIGKFVKELGKSNPESLCAIYTPADKIIKWDQRLKPLWDLRSELLSKSAFQSFRGYAKSQILKMEGLSKAMMIDPTKVKERKSPLNFCWVPRPGSDGAWTLEKWLREKGLKQEYAGLSRLPNGVELYTLYYDWFADPTLPYEKYEGEPMTKEEFEERKKKGGIGYRGILDPTNPTTQLRLSSIPKSESFYPLCTFQFNSNAFSRHCSDYKKYWDWVKNRNPQRYNSNLGHCWDSKNTLHSIRIMRMGIELAEGKGLLLDRRKVGDREELLKIKRHEFQYSEIKEMVLKTEERMKEAFDKSTLSDEPPKDKLEEALIQVRENVYGVSSNKYAN